MIMQSKGRQLAFLFFLTVSFIPKLAAAEPDRGQKIYANWCEGCHMDSPFAPGTIQLRKLRGDDQALILKRTDITADYLRHIVRKGMNGMPLFRRVEISDAELESLVQYLVKD